MKVNFFKFLKNVVWGMVHFPTLTIIHTKKFVGSVFYIVNFFVLLLLYLTIKIAHHVGRLPFIPGPLVRLIRPIMSAVYVKVVAYSRYKDESINRVNLIDMALRNMTFKKTRTLITVGGMVIGIAAIVFLVSIGYGLQELVITRVARLDELKQAVVSTQTGSNVGITDETLSNVKAIHGVSQVLPLIAVVGRVNYQNSVTDMAVYGVTKSYLEQSAIKTIKGTLFESNDVVSNVPVDTKGDVAGIEDSSEEIAVMGDKIRDVTVYIEPNKWIKVRKGPDATAPIIGYTKRTEGALKAEELWGSDYTGAPEGNAGKDSEDKPMGKWIKAPVQLWDLQACKESNPNCVDGKYLVIRDEDGLPKTEIGYFAQLNTSVNKVAKVEGAVLAETDEVLAAVDEEGSGSGAQWVDIASESGALMAKPVKTIPLGSTAKRQAVVNKAMLQVLGISQDEAIGKTFSASFVVIGEAHTVGGEKVESAPADYTIVGVVPDDQTPVFYVPFIDLRGLGITNYTQLKVTVKNPDDLAKIRQQMEGYGFVTSSVADTVEQINNLFATARIVLALLGMVALGVSALGMFNTLTVSLLERTREVGLMKAMGMRSTEVQELFLTESMTMGFFGGVVGILVGYAMGKLLGIIISAFAIFKGVGFIDISHIPWFFVLVVIFLSVIVGVLTGIYPARRAKRISALDALRYE